MTLSMNTDHVLRTCTGTLLKPEPFVPLFNTVTEILACKIDCTTHTLSHWHHNHMKLVRIVTIDRAVSLNGFDNFKGLCGERKEHSTEKASSTKVTKWPNLNLGYHRHIIPCIEFNTCHSS